MSISKNKPDENSPAARAQYHHRMRNDWDDLMEELIQDGKEKGVFDNLSGKGKPLKLGKYLFAGDMAFANELMKENDIPPAWIQERNSILEETAVLRTNMERQWDWHQREMAAAGWGEKGRVTISWDDYCLKWIATIQKLNKRIVTYNLKRPLENMELFKLNIDKELERIEAPRYFT